MYNTLYMNIKAIALDWGYAYVTKVQIAVCKTSGWKAKTFRIMICQWCWVPQI